MKLVDDCCILAELASALGKVKNKEFRRFPCGKLSPLKEILHYLYGKKCMGADVYRAFRCLLYVFKI